jgi:hypothetical protein
METLEEGHRMFSLADSTFTWFSVVTSGVGHVSRPVAPVPYGELNDVSAAAPLLDSQGRLKVLLP